MAILFFVGLDELLSKFNIIFPDYNKFLRLAEKEILEKLIIEFIQKKPCSLNDLVSILRYDRDEIRQILEELTQRNKILSKLLDIDDMKLKQHLALLHKLRKDKQTD